MRNLKKTDKTKLDKLVNKYGELLSNGDTISNIISYEENMTLNINEYETKEMDINRYIIDKLFELGCNNSLGKRN